MVVRVVVLRGRDHRLLCEEMSSFQPPATGGIERSDRVHGLHLGEMVLDEIPHAIAPKPAHFQIIGLKLVQARLRPDGHRSGWQEAPHLVSLQ